MKSFFKKIALVLALAMVVTMLPAKVVSAADAEGPQLAKQVKLYIGGDKSGAYSDTAYAKVWNKAGYTVEFSSDNEAVATVGKRKGLVTAVSVGSATITAVFTNEDGETVTKTCPVVVKKNAVAVGISDNSAKELEAGIAVGETFQPKVFRTSADDVTTWKGKDVITDGARFESSDEKVFTVKKTTGKITAVGVGEATLSVWTVQGEKPVKDENGKVVEYLATTDKVEYTVKVVSGGLVSAKQTTYDTVEITCDSEAAAKEVLDKSAALKAVQVINEQDIDVPVKSVEKTSDAKVVKVVMYSNLVKDITYKFSYDNGEAVSVVGADLTAIDHIMITNDRIPVGKEETLKVKFYDANNVELPDPDDISYNLTFKTDNIIDCSLAGNVIYFWEPNKQVAVTAVYNMGWDQEGKKIADKEDTKVLTSAVDETNSILGWSVGEIGGEAGVWWRGYNTDTITMAAGDSQKQLYVKFSNREANGNVNDKFNVSNNGSQVASDAGAYRYASTRDTVLLVGSTDGRIDPVGPGSAQIIISKVVGNTEVTVTVINVTVVANRYLATLEANINGSKLSSAAAGTLESLRITLTAKDQLGSIMKESGTDGTIAVSTQVLGSDQVKTAAAVTVVPDGEDGNNIYFKITTNTTSTTEVSIPIQVTVSDAQGNTRTRTFTINVKAPGAVDTSKYQLVLSNDQIDLNFANNSWHWNGFNGRYHSEISLKAYDAQGYLVQYETITVLSQDGLKAMNEGGTGTPGDFYFTVLHNQKDATVDYVGVANGKPYFTAVSGSAENIEKITQDGTNGFGLGAYTVRAYKVDNNGKAQMLSGVFKNISVLDTTAPASVTVDSNAVSGADVSGGKISNTVLRDKLIFYRGSDKINKDNVVVIGSDSVQNGNTVYVRTVTVKVTYAENGDSFNWIYKINVNQQFYVK